MNKRDLGKPTSPMKSSLCHTSNFNEISSYTIDYKSWMMEHPSALGSFENMMRTAKGRRIVVFLDYDGTLSPIVDDPDCAFMSDEMRAAVSEVASYFPTAIISGRSRDKVKEFVKLNNVYYAGSHGMDILVPMRQQSSCDLGRCHHVHLDDRGQDALVQPAKKFLPAIQEIIKLLKDITRNIHGAEVEDNKFCISVHFRRVHEEDYGILEERVKSMLKGFPDFCLNNGKKVLEIRPSIEWNKGHALEYLLNTFGFENTSDIMPFYIGDDRTDEDAFKVIRTRGQGFPIIVSSIPVETKASYSLQNPSEVLQFLLRLARNKKKTSSGWSFGRLWGHR